MRLSTQMAVGSLSCRGGRIVVESYASPSLTLDRSDVAVGVSQHPKNPLMSAAVSREERIQSSVRTSMLWGSPAPVFLFHFHFFSIMWVAQLEPAADRNFYRLNSPSSPRTCSLVSKIWVHPSQRGSFETLLIHYSTNYRAWSRLPTSSSSYLSSLVKN